MEEYKDIKGFDGLYAINKLGDIKSLERYVITKNNSVRIVNERILKINIYDSGYKYITLCKDGKQKSFTLHKLLYKTFISDYDSRYYEIDHIDRNRSNNNLENLRLVSTRNNSNNRTDQSKYGVGVTINKYNRFLSRISINNKKVFLGIFLTKEEANEKYKKVKFKLEEIEK